jgi:hypothetical protein
MPIERDSIISNASEQWRPTLVDDGAGNLVPGGPEAKVTNCVAGVVPRSINHDPFQQLGGGTVNAQRWLVVVRGAPTVSPNESIHVLQGTYIGKYRVQVVEQVPNETLILTQCLRET